MSDDDVRAGIQQAELGKIGSNFLTIEATVIGLIIGLREQSWVAGIFAWLGTMILFHAMASSEKLANALAVVIGAAWGFAAFQLVQSGDASPDATWGIAIVVGLMGFGGHIAGFQYLRDIQKAKG